MSDPDTPAGTDHWKIQRALQAADSATLHTDEGGEIEIDLRHLNGDADITTWGIEDTTEHDGDGRHYRNRLRLFADAEFLGHSDTEDSGGFETAGTLKLNVEIGDVEAARGAALDEIDRALRELEQEVASGGGS